MRTKAEIRNKIQIVLRKRPMNSWEISVDTEININSVKRHLAYLESIGVLEQKTHRWAGTKEKLWQVKGSNRLPEKSSFQSLKGFVSND